MTYTSRYPIGKTLAALLVLVASGAAQVRTSAHPTARITAQIDNARITQLAGTHPAIVERATVGARLESSTPLKNLRLVLSPSDDQLSALQSLMAEQQDKTSPNYHQWLTPETFGQYFGVAAGDLAQITAWLQDQGFTVESVAKGGRVVTFSGTSGQVETAFHTQLNRITVDGEAHIANTSDISVPTALSSVVKGIASLNDFFPKGNVVNPHQVVIPKLPADNYVTMPGQPNYTSASSGAHYVAPGDAAIIFNSTPLLNAGIDGTGQTIAVLGRTDITLSDVQQFRSMFGLKKNDPTFTIIGEDPGINSDDIEAYLDVEWSGGMAPGVSVSFIDGGSDYITTSGISTAGLYAVDNNLADIITLSYGGCETSNGASGTAFWNTLWEQAAAQGQSVFVSSGDSDATGCQSSSATYGTAYGVNALGSSAYNVAVGGSMFVDFEPSQYWNGPNQATPFTTALSYIPEAVWNQGALSTTYLNTLSTATQSGSGIVGAGGGISIYTARPAWQVGSGISTTADPTPPQGTGIAAGSPISGVHRLVPDIVSIAASGHDSTAFCAEGLCYDTSTGYGIGAVGGTSVATPVMASVQALINQKNGGRQGNPNFHYYPLANLDYAAGNCQSVNGTAANPTVTLPASTCNFHDVVAGSNRAPSSSTDTVGLGFNAAVGFDAASGLGSLNINNVATNWSAVSLRATTTTFTLSPTAGLTHGASQVLNVSVAAISGTPTGDFSLIAETTTPSEKLQFTLTGGAYSGSISGLPGGNYNVYVHYSGDGTYAPSDSASVPVSIAKETSTVSQALYYFIPGGYYTNPTTVPYGVLVDLVSTATGTSSKGVPTGTMTYAVSQNGTALAGLTSTLDSNGTTALEAGAAYTSLYLAPNYPSLAPGSYTISATYSGDASFSGNSASNSFTVAKLTPTVSFNSSAAYITSGGTVTLNLTVSQTVASYFPTLAAYPSGTVTFTDTTSGTVLGSATLNSVGVASLKTTGITTTGANAISAVYSGDANYAGNTGTGTVTVGSYTSTSTTLTAANAAGGTDYVGSTTALTATVTPAVAGTVSFYDGATRLGTATSSASTGIATLSTTALTAGSHTLSAVFGGTTTYAGSTGSTSLTVSQNVTTLILDAPTASTYGQPLSINGRISRSPSLATPVVGLTGTVTFYAGSTAIGSATPVYLPSYGYYTATLTAPVLAAGNQTISATYMGDSNYATSTSGTVTTAVAPLTPTLTLTTTTGTTVYGTGSIVYLEIILPASSALATPTGKLMLTNTITTASYTGTFNYNAAAGGFVANINLAGLNGPQSFVASLAADSNYNAATSNTLTLLVTKNNVWVANGNGSVSGLTESGTAVTSSAVSGGGTAIAIDNAGDIWSLNKSASSVAKFTSAGASLTSGYTQGGISTPSALAIDGQGYVWIANGNNTISVLNLTGTPVSTTPYSSSIPTPTSIDVDASGNLWITNSGDNSVTQVIGVAAPVTTPTTTAVKNNGVAARP